MKYEYPRLLWIKPVTASGINVPHFLKRATGGTLSNTLFRRSLLPSDHFYPPITHNYNLSASFSSSCTLLDLMEHQHFVPSDAQMTSIVLPTIVFCIGMVVAMLIGINKCKEWDLDRIVEMRRTRRVLQRITARLREKNFKTIQSKRC